MTGALHLNTHLYGFLINEGATHLNMSHSCDNL